MTLLAALAGCADGDALDPPDEPEDGVDVVVQISPEDLALEPARLDFGVVPVGTTRRATFTVRFTGPAGRWGLVFDSSHPDVVVPAEALGGLFELSPGDAVDVDAAFTPSVAGPVQGTLRLRTEGGLELGHEIEVFGVGEGLPDCVIEADPNPVEAGAIEAGGTRRREVTLAHVGGGPCEVALAPEGPVSLAEDGPSSLRFTPDGASKRLTLWAGPGACAPAAILLMSGAREVGRLSVVARPLEPGRLAAPVEVEAAAGPACTARVYVDLEVDGERPVELRRATLDRTDWRLVLPGALPLELTPGETTTLEIEAPVLDAEAAAKLNLEAASVDDCDPTLVRSDAQVGVTIRRADVAPCD